MALTGVFPLLFPGQHVAGSLGRSIPGLSFQPKALLRLRSALAPNRFCGKIIWDHAPLSPLRQKSL